MRDLQKIDEGWYQDIAGHVYYQRWWRALGSPLKKAGWYVWSSRGSSLIGVFPTLAKARKVGAHDA